MNANAMQVGGSHYRAEVQHWDLIEIYGIGYLEGCATKYLTRFEKKNGMQDLDKAEHYAVKLLELHRTINRQPRGIVPIEAVSKFVIANDVDNTSAETAIIFLLRWQTETDLMVAIEAIKRAKIKYLQDIAVQPGASSPRIEHPNPFGYDADWHA